MSSSSRYDPDLLYRSTYLAREYRMVTAMKEELQGIILAPTEGPFHVSDGIRTGVDNESFASTDSGAGYGGSSSSLVAKWRGIVFLRHKDSPWVRGAFGFTIEFPPRYPFECPVCTFDKPGIKSQPFLRDGIELMFQAEYTSINPMQVSVLVRLVKFIRRLFSHTCENIDLIDRAAAQRDVHRSPISYPLMVELEKRGVGASGNGRPLEVSTSGQQALAISVAKYVDQVLVTEEVMDSILLRAESRKHELEEEEQATVGAGSAAGSDQGRIGVIQATATMANDFGTWFSTLFTTKVIPQSRSLH